MSDWNDLIIIQALFISVFLCRNEWITQTNDDLQTHAAAENPVAFSLHRRALIRIPVLENEPHLMQHC